MKIFLLLLISMLICDYSWAQKTEEFDVTFEQDITVEGKIEAVSTTESSKPCPAMTEVQRDTIVSPANGSCVYNTTTSLLNVYNGSLWKSAGGGGISPWASAFNYVENDVVIQADKIYQCLTAHTSTIFASDITNWKLISDNLPIDLSAHVTGVLPMANGGTDKNLTPVLGGLVYTDDLSMEVLAAGTSGQVLKSNGAAAPTWEDASNKVQGQDQTEVDFTKLQFPNKSVTQTATGSQLVYDSGLIFDGGFESATAFQGHTIVSGATYFSVVTAASDVLDGKKTARVTCFNAAPSGVCKIEQTVNLGTFRLNGFPMLLSVRVESSPDQPLTFCAKIDGVEKDCVTGYKGYLTIPTQAGSTSVGYTLSKNEYVSPLTSLFDSIKVEITETVTNAPVVGPEIPYTPVFSNVTTPTNINFTYQQIGSNVLIKGYYTGAGGTATNELRIGLPSGMTTSNRINPIQSLGTLNSSYSGAFDGARFIIATSNKSYLNVGLYSTVTSGLSVANVSSVGFVSGRNYSFEVLVPINELASSVPTYSDRCRDPRNCETVVSFNSSTTAVVSETNDWINGNGTVSSSVYQFPLNTGVASSKMVCAASIDQNIASNRCATVTHDTVNNRIEVRLTACDSSGTGLRTDAPFSVICQRQGQDYLNAKVNQIVGSFKDYVKTEGTASGRVDFFTVSYGGANAGQTSVTNCTSTPCNIDEIGANGTYVTQISRAAQGAYRLDTTRTYSKLKCTGTTLSVGLGQRYVYGTLQCKSCNQMVFYTGYGGTDYDSAGNLFCQGTY